MLCLILTAMAGALASSPGLRAAVSWAGATGEKQCTLAETLRSARYFQELQAARSRIAGSARMVERDGELQLWEVPGARRFWLYRKFDGQNAFTFAEQVARQYDHPDVHVKRGDIVLDCGADYGSVTWRALEAGASKVVAIEIAPEKWTCLNRTFAREIAEGRVVVVPAGVWDREDTVELGADSVVFAQKVEKRKVRVTTIDRIVEDLGLPRVDFIAMDIEGAEKQALRGGAGTIRRFHPRMAIAAEHLPDDATAIPAEICAMAPRYQTICSVCEMQPGRGLVSNILFFKPL